jgi:hypothetical protein
MVTYAVLAGGGELPANVPPTQNARTSAGKHVQMTLLLQSAPVAGFCGE